MYFCIKMESSYAVMDLSAVGNVFPSKSCATRNTTALTDLMNTMNAVDYIEELRFYLIIVCLLLKSTCRIFDVMQTNHEKLGKFFLRKKK